MMKRASRRSTGRLRDGLIVGLVVGTLALAGVAGEALFDNDTDATTREYAHHMAQHTVTLHP